MTRFFLIIFVFPFYCKAQIITTVVGNGYGGGIINHSFGATGGLTGDGGPATAAELYGPHSVAFDSYGNLYIADCVNNVIRKVDTFGIITTYAGNGDNAGNINQIWGLDSGDGGPATLAQLNLPLSIAFDNENNLYIADADNNVIRKVNSSGVISTYAGVHLPPPSTAPYEFGDGGPATSALLMGVVCLVVDKLDNLYFTDTRGCVRKIDTNGILTTVFSFPNLGSGREIAIDKTGNFYVGDYDYQQIYKISTAGETTVIAGNGTSTLGHETGDGGPATSAQIRPESIALDTLGNLFISEFGSVRMVNAKGMITTIAGTGATGYSGDGGNATSAQLNSLGGLAFDKKGNLFIADNYNNRVRMVQNNFDETYNIIVNNIASDIQNPNNGTFLLEGSLSSTNDETIFVEIYDKSGQGIYKNSIVAQKGKIKEQIILGENIPDGIYILYLKSQSQKRVSRFVVEKGKQ